MRAPLLDVTGGPARDTVVSVTHPRVDSAHDGQLPVLDAEFAVVEETDPDRHGLSETDLAQVRNAAEHARPKQERRRRSISVGGRAFDVYAGDFTTLTRELQRVLENGAIPGVAAGGSASPSPRH